MVDANQENDKILQLIDIAVLSFSSYFKSEGRARARSSPVNFP